MGESAGAEPNSRPARAPRGALAEGPARVDGTLMWMPREPAVFGAGEPWSRSTSATPSATSRTIGKRRRERDEITRNRGVIEVNRAHRVRSSRGTELTTKEAGGSSTTTSSAVEPREASSTVRTNYGIGRVTASEEEPPAAPSGYAEGLAVPTQTTPGRQRGKYCTVPLVYRARGRTACGC